jgi:hypothetical protein
LQGKELEPTNDNISGVGKLNEILQSALKRWAAVTENMKDADFSQFLEEGKKTANQITIESISSAPKPPPASAAPTSSTPCSSSLSP